MAALGEERPHQGKALQETKQGLQWNLECSKVVEEVTGIEEELAQGARAQGGKNLPQGQNRQCQDRKITDSKCR